MSLRGDLEVIEMRLMQQEKIVGDLEIQVNDLDEKRKAAQELKLHAEGVLKKPVVIDGNGNSWRGAKEDIQWAEDVLAKIARQYGPLEERLRRAKVLLENVRAEKKNFPMDRLREEERVQKLRQKASYRDPAPFRDIGRI